MADAPPNVFDFAHFRLETGERRLLADGVPVHITPKAFDVLCVLVRHHAHLVTKAQLMEHVWPDTFVGDAVLTRCIADLRKAFGEAAGDSRYIETIAKQGYRFVAPVRIVEGAAAEQVHVDRTTAAPPPTFEDIQREVRSAQTSRKGYAKIAVGAVAVLLVAAAIAMRDSGGLERAPSLDVRSLAVLPFSGLDDKGAEAYLGLGITDALITRLSSIRHIAVRPISAVRAFAGHDAVAAGRAMKVDLVLDGSIQRDANRIRVTVRLLETGTGAARWAATFDETLDNLFAIEDAISRRVADALPSGALGNDRSRLTRRETEHPEAHRAYLEGRYFLSKRTKDQLERAIASLKRAVALDANYALAHAALADAYLLAAQWLSSAETTPKARAAAQTSLQLDPLLAEAHSTLGLIAMNYDWDWSEAERQYQRAIELNPSYATAHHWYGEYLAWMGRFDEGLAEVRRAEELDPLSLPIKTDVGKVLLIARRYDDAILQWRRTVDLDPHYAPAWGWMAAPYIHKGLFDEALAALTRGTQGPEDPGRIVGLAEIYSRRRQHAELLGVRDRLLTLAKRAYVPLYHLARMQFLAGNVDEGFAALSRMIDDREVGVICLKHDPGFDDVRPDPRFKELLRRVGFTP